MCDGTVAGCGCGIVDIGGGLHRGALAGDDVG